MPFRFVCSHCGRVLCETEDILKYMTERNRRKKASATPPITQFIIHKIGGKCPECGHELARVPVGVEVYPCRRQTYGENKNGC